MDYRIVTWNEINSLCHDLSQWIKKCHSDIDVLYGIPTGGLVPAVIVGNLIRIKPSLTLDVRTRMDVFWKRKKILILDDINDTGETLRGHSHEDNRVFVTLFGRESSTFKTDWTGEVLKDKVWLVWPWECQEDAEREYSEYMEKRKCLI